MIYYDGSTYIVQERERAIWIDTWDLGITWDTTYASKDLSDQKPASSHYLIKKVFSGPIKKGHPY